MADVVVVGSLNCDLVMRVLRLPRPGETVPGSGFETFVGGKGCNQAIAAARAGAKVAMIGRVGCDAYGDRILEVLRRAGVDVTGVVRDETEGTGVAQIFVDDAGQNVIGVAPRANGRVGAASLSAFTSLLERARVLLLQLEIPVEAGLEAARVVRAAGGRVVLNPAPIPADPASLRELLGAADLVVPNETEAEALTGVACADRARAAEAARALGAASGGAVVVTLGDRGAIVAERGAEPVSSPAFMVPVVDTTAAGDAFAGALAASLAAGADLVRAARLANAAGALACTRAGAEPSLPTREAIEALVARADQGT